MGLRAERADRQAAEKDDAMRYLSPRGIAAILVSFALSGITFSGITFADEPQPFARRSPVVEAVTKTKASIVCVRVPRPGGGKDMIGTGVIVDPSGLIVTNRHVVAANRSATVCLSDNTALKADVLVADPGCDLAILQVQAAKPLPFLKTGPRSDLMVGETVIAIGHPFGYTNTVSTGIISALDREITMPTQDVITGLIQITAAINPGNSGGPLLNVNGELIGINVALREGAQGIAFAINASDVEAFLIKHRSARKVSGINHRLQYAEKVIAETGDRQRVVLTGAPAELGLQQGDEIRAVGDHQVVNAFDLERAFCGRKPGEQVALKVVRQGQELTLNLTLAAGQGAGQVANLAPLPTAPAADVATPGVFASAPR
jgi:serine protease Do